MRQRQKRRGRRNSTWLSDWLILYREGGGLRVGGWVCLVFPDFGENAGTHPAGVFRFFGWVGGLVDHQRCSWAEAHCDTSVHASSCGKLCLGLKKHFFLQVDHSNGGDEI